MEEKKTLDGYLPSYVKINSGYARDLHTKSKLFFDENTEKNLHNSMLGNVFLSKIQKV